MSRIGNRILSIPAGVEVAVENNTITVKGSKGELTLDFAECINVEVKEGNVYTTRINDIKTSKQLHGTTNANIKNMLEGVSEGFSKSLEIVGVGYNFQVKGDKLGIKAGFSHPVELDVPSNLKLEGISNTEIKISGIDKQAVGEFAAKVRGIRPPEPYKGKGIKYKGEKIRRKEGKKASK